MIHVHVAAAMAVVGRMKVADTVFTLMATTITTMMCRIIIGNVSMMMMMITGIIVEVYVAVIDGTSSTCVYPVPVHTHLVVKGVVAIRLSGSVDCVERDGSVGRLVERKAQLRTAFLPVSVQIRVQGLGRQYF